MSITPNIKYYFILLYFTFYRLNNCCSVMTCALLRCKNTRQILKLVI